MLPLQSHSIDYKLHENAEQVLRNVKDLVMSEIFSYFAVLTGQPCFEIINALKGAIYKRLNNYNVANQRINKHNTSVIMLLKEVVCKMDNEKTQKNVLGIVSNFERFLKEAKIADSVVSICQATMRQYRDWLVSESGVSNKRGKQCLEYLFNLLTKIEWSKGIEFDINKSKILPISETRSMTERSNNSIALTEEEVKAIETVDLPTERLRIARDIFLLQCYCGFRFEDLSRLLDKNNIKERKGFVYSVFETQKKNIISHTPLNNPQFFPQAYEIFKRYVGNSPYTDKQHNIYNKAIKEIAKRANLDREITYTFTRGGKKLSEAVKVYDKIASHCARHTFITNCIRYKHITPKDLKHITGHSDTKMIESVYCNLKEEDKIDALNNVVTTNNNTLSVTHVESDIKGIAEAKSVLTYLGIEFDNSLGFEELVNLISDRQYYIADNYGIDIKILKDIYNLNLPLISRVRALKSLLRGILEVA